MGRLIRLVSLYICVSFALVSGANGQAPSGVTKGVLPQRQAAGAPQVAASVGRLPGQPEWFPLTAEHEKYLNTILKYWEFEASKVQRFKCTFDRWEYEPV